MQGDERAFTEIVNSITDRFLGTAQRILRDASLAEDAVHLERVIDLRRTPLTKFPVEQQRARLEPLSG
jgi:hypothetical protein